MATFNPAKKLLDRRGGRTLLGYLVTASANLRGNKARIFYDGCWIHQFDTDYFADWAPLTRRNLPSWLNQERRYWLSFYAPNLGDTIIDVGAGVGIETILFSRAVGERGRVLAIEAHPRTYACLLKTCQYNALNNVVALNIALVDNECAVSLEDSPQHIGNAIVPGKQGSIQVRGRRLDDVCDEHRFGEIALVRMNIEGAEKLAIRGMESMLAKTTHVAIACHDFKADRTGNEFFRTKKDVIGFLLDRGFKIVEMSFEKPWAKDHVYAYNASLTTNPVASDSGP